MSVQPTAPLIRFWPKVDRSAGTDGCWPWTGGTNEHGYGILGLGGKGAGFIKAHRMAYAVAFGLVPDFTCVLHHCDNPPCCNPDHLYIGDQKQNARDMKARGRVNPSGFLNLRPGAKGVRGAGPRSYHDLIESAPAAALPRWEKGSRQVRIIHGAEPIIVQNPIFHVIGDTGIGKSSLLGMAGGKGLVLDFDLGIHRTQNRPDAAQIRTWADLEGLVAEASAYDVIGVDTVGRCLDVLSLEIIRAEPKMGKDGQLTQAGWGKLKSRFRNWLTELRAMGKVVVLLSHAREEKDGETRIVRADVAGGSYAEVMRVADFVGYMTMAGHDRVLDFNPTDRYCGKNPGGWEAIRVPHYLKEPEFLTGLINRGRKALGAISEQGAAALSLIADWTAKLEECTDADEINALTSAIEKVTPAVVQAQVKVLRSQRAKALGLVADVKAKKYLPAPKQETAEVGA
jgi:hypothetical protein